MAIHTLSDLVSSVASFAWRTDDREFIASIPTFIGFAEARFNHELRVRWMEASAPITVTNGEGDLPDDYLSYRNVFAGGCLLDAVDPSWVAARGNVAGPFFAIIGNKMRVYAPGDVVLNYYQQIPALCLTNPTNWLLKRSPSMYLYGSLLEAAPYMIDDQRLATWGSMFDRAMANLVAEDATAKYANTQARVAGPTP